MKPRVWKGQLTGLLCLGVGFMAAGIGSAAVREVTPADVTGNRVNVRARPSLVGIVVAQVSQGDRVEVLDLVSLKDPPKGGPNDWAKIRMPEAVNVWLHADYLSADGAETSSNEVGALPSKLTVEPDRLNVRAGPGLNFGVVGQLHQGDAVSPISQQGKWFKVKRTEGAYAFIAARFLANAETGELLAKPKESGPTTSSQEAKAKESAQQGDSGDSATASDEEGADEEATARELSEAGDVAVEKVPEKTSIRAVSDDGAEEEATAPKQADGISGDLTPVPERIRQGERVVHRKGVVKPTASIQAPTYYGLRSIYDGTLMNYIYSPSNHILFKDYTGKRVLVRGQEFLDERWPTTPVLKAEELRAVQQEPSSD